jgi:hypothetical protein
MPTIGDIYRYDQHRKYQTAPTDTPSDRTSTPRTSPASHTPCQAGLNHIIWIWGSGDKAVDCVFLGPDASELAADQAEQENAFPACVPLSYDDSWVLDG